MITEQSIQQEILNYQSKILDLQTYSACLNDQLKSTQEKLEGAIQFIKTCPDIAHLDAEARDFLASLSGDCSTSKEGG